MIGSSSLRGMNVPVRMPMPELVAPGTSARLAGASPRVPPRGFPAAEPRSFPPGARKFPPLGGGSFHGG